MICFKCERKMDEDALFDVNLFHHFKTKFHYGSDHDLEEWSFTVCEPCLLTFTDSFKKKPDSREYTFDEELGYDDIYLEKIGMSADFDGDELAIIQDNSSSTDSVADIKEKYERVELIDINEHPNGLKGIDGKFQQNLNNIFDKNEDE